MVGNYKPMELRGCSITMSYLIVCVLDAVCNMMLVCFYVIHEVLISKAVILFCCS